MDQLHTLSTQFLSTYEQQEVTMRDATEDKSHQTYLREQTSLSAAVPSHEDVTGSTRWKLHIIMAFWCMNSAFLVEAAQYGWPARSSHCIVYIGSDPI